MFLTRAALIPFLVILGLSTVPGRAMSPIVDFTVEKEWWFGGEQLSGFYKVVDRTGPGTNVHSVIVIRGKQLEVPFRVTTAASVCVAAGGLAVLFLVLTQQRNHGVVVSAPLQRHRCAIAQPRPSAWVKPRSIIPGLKGRNRRFIPQCTCDSGPSGRKGFLPIVDPGRRPGLSYCGPLGLWLPGALNRNVERRATEHPTPKNSCPNLKSQMEPSPQKSNRPWVSFHLNTGRSCRSL